MSDNVIPLRAYKDGDTTFLMCPCKPNTPEPFIPIVLAGDKPLIVALMCPECEQTVSVLNGYVLEAKV